MKGAIGMTWQAKQLMRGSVPLSMAAWCSKGSIGNLCAEMRRELAFPLHFITIL
jgi:hypothetical protein